MDTASLFSTSEVMEGVCLLSGRLWVSSSAPRSNAILCATESGLSGKWCRAEHEGLQDILLLSPLLVVLVSGDPGKASSPHGEMYVK